MILSSAVGAEDTALLVDTIRAAVGRADPADGRSERVYRDGPLDHDLWSVLGREIGVGALAVPETHGGLGTSYATVAAVLETLGAELTRVPVLGSVIAATALARCAEHPLARDLLEEIASGTRIVATVVPGDDLDTPGDGTFRAVDGGEGVTLTGRAEFVLDAVAADTVLVHAVDRYGSLGLYAVDRTHLTVEPMQTTDATRGLARVHAEDVPATLLTDRPEPGRVRDQALVALACDSLGVARACLDAAVAYAKERVQFGRVIGEFQAIKHMLAEVAVAVELADSAVAHAIWAVEEGTDRDLAEAAAIAALACGDAADLATATNVQVHGGIGFTWEHTAHLYYRRALGSSVLWGSADDHAQRLYLLATDSARSDDAPNPDRLREPASALFAPEA
ncbi:acyl-CoA dehydrogenase family protein [Rhodococcus sp. NPDC003382]|uniref:acyl-CoA dehydrogenase family protein n=1 Tax=unclassified Rhodococcus (in: high G+C Gram-positive bacteria) TaxID=192944 RepID=UPI0018CEA9AB|nr:MULTISPECIES: acyl-CoA dehydrogenase family protein [unclassified Rhodococcus (in: high G+C Gram-positive bacteria)]MBH0120338.1 acyl-CoA/acyl-ACP dehydrogenase [Rhodococcus sp. CX]MCK8674912.1 acyl-CoA/acyl-ACP dehydrogenase [Rhodococcus sp. HM1]